MRHALEPDHLAAVASISTRRQGLWERISEGAVWGVGHTLALIALGGVSILLGDILPDDLTAWLEGAVGLMLVMLGIDVLRRIKTEQVHLHAHSHEKHSDHMHLHSHRESPSHGHLHLEKIPYRALFVGLMHGLAGSAALILLVVSAAVKPADGMVYVLVFGLGSILGMIVLSAVISVPLRTIPERFQHQLHFGLGVATVAIGLLILSDFVDAIA